VFFVMSKNYGGQVVDKTDTACVCVCVCMCAFVISLQGGS
jgi:hypothetical protein